MPERDRTEDRREEILAAAMKVFDARGFAGTTIHAVAEEAGVAKGSVYNYFRSKRELFYQAFSHVLGSAKADTDAILSDPHLSPAVKLRSLLDYWSQRLAYHVAFGRLVLEFWATAARDEKEGDLTAAFAETYAYWRDRMGILLAEGIRQGEFVADLDPYVAASLVMALLDGIEVQSIMPTGLRLDADFLEATKRAVLTGLSRGACDRQDV